MRSPTWGSYTGSELEIGETSIVIAVAAPHRKAAFAACEWLIRELKRTVPIWKKEFYADGSELADAEDAALTISRAAPRPWSEPADTPA